MSTWSKSEGEIERRKKDHIEVCGDGARYAVESPLQTGFCSLSFLHNALPELSLDEIRTELTFLGKEISFPFFISCMTGGAAEARKINQQLAIAAQKTRVPLGLGSVRVLFESSSHLPDFQMRPYAPDIPIMANIGAVQLRDSDLSHLSELIRALEVDALVVHLNCGQELFQERGDRDFRGLFDAIKRAVETLSLPLIVKETGFGILPALAEKLLGFGASYVDVAGAGGTNWIAVENQRGNFLKGEGDHFAGWGVPTPLLLEATSHCRGKILASGGIRSGLDLAKAIALGAVAGGAALPLFRAALRGGAEGAASEIDSFRQTLLRVMLLTGSGDLRALQSAPLFKTLQYERDLLVLRSSPSLS